MLADILVVVVGGGIGAGLRFLISHAMPTDGDGFPWATFIVNLTGCFVLGVISGIAVRTNVMSRPMLLFLGTGMCGGFTTFSTFSMEAMNLFHAGHFYLVAAYIGGSLVGGLGAAALGLLIVRYQTP